MKTKLFVALICSAFLVAHCLNFTEIFNSPEMRQLKHNAQMEEKSEKFNTVVPFPCRKLNPSYPPPEDASKLRFSDIKVMMALGDSITAGFGMVSLSIYPITIFSEEQKFCRIHL
jgi:hypothetical protein